MKFAVITPALITGSLRKGSFHFIFTLHCPFQHSSTHHYVTIWYPDGLLNKYFKDLPGHCCPHERRLRSSCRCNGFRKRKRPHHEPSILLLYYGTGMLWFGWFGFNAGSALAANATAALAFGTTTIASASAMMTWIFLTALTEEKYLY
jgi:Amt family ammonium transporter